MEHSQNKYPYSVPLTSLIEEFHLETFYAPPNLDEIKIVTSDVNRPGLQLAGFFDYFDPMRIQIIGKVEANFLKQYTYEERRKIFGELLSKNIPALIISRGIEPFDECIEMARIYNTPLLMSKESTAGIMSAIVASLNVSLAPRITRHGVLVEVYGEGVLLWGDSGVGKSEIAIELVKRGHRLIADDAVEIKKVSAKTLVGSSPELIRHYIELRGIGVVDVRRIFGVGAVKMTEKIDLVITLEHWRDDAVYDRLGLDETTTDILGINIASLTVPVKPGRNLAVIIEVAAMNNRHKKMGYNAALEFTEGINKYFAAHSPEESPEKS
ncbi:MAG: HPr(Ser) kinase/phosphatase [Oscillospiraceae bacterium]|nr:HPr(Ser) kinase/phosphatase [Oscillospiraceae bacterium]